MSTPRRNLGVIGLLFASIGGILGSGWLFGPLYAVQYAGPAALVAWVLGGFAIMLIALTFAEVSSRFPLNGGITRHALLAYGRMSGFLVSLCTWFAFTVVIAAEVQATLQYASIHLPWLTRTEADGTHPLTPEGFGIAALLWIIFSIITWMGIKWFARINGLLTWVKIGLIVIVTVSLIVLSFHWTMFDDVREGGFAPDGWRGIFRALSYGGVIYAFTGFQHAVVAAGESKRPHRDIPIAVVGSILICMVLDLAIQMAFLGAVSEALVPKGWAALTFKGQVGPLAGLALTLGVTWLFIMVFAGAIISPLGAGLIDLGSSVRIAQGMTQDGYVPQRLGRLGRFHTPGIILIISFPIGLLMFLPFPGWQDLVAFLASIVIVAYAMGPLGVLALRRQFPDQTAAFRLPWAGLICPTAFIVCGLLIYWSGWDIVWKLCAAFGITSVLFVLLKKGRGHQIDFVASCWIWPFLGGLCFLTFAGGHGGRQWIPFGWDIATVAGWSLLCFLLGVRLALPPERAAAYLDEIQASTTQPSENTDFDHSSGV